MEVKVQAGENPDKVHDQLQVKFFNGQTQRKLTLTSFRLLNTAPTIGGAFSVPIFGSGSGSSSVASGGSKCAIGLGNFRSVSIFSKASIS